VLGGCGVVALLTVACIIWMAVRMVRKCECLSDVAPILPALVVGHVFSKELAACLVAHEQPHVAPAAPLLRRPAQLVPEDARRRGAAGDHRPPVPAASRAAQVVVAVLLEADSSTRWRAGLAETRQLVVRALAGPRWFRIGAPFVATLRRQESRKLYLPVHLIAGDVSRAPHLRSVVAPDQPDHEQHNPQR